MNLQRIRAAATHRLWLTYASLTLACSSVSVAAQPTASERDTARTLLHEAESLRASGDLRGALGRYQSAHALMRVPTTGLELARAQAQLGLLVEARCTATEVIHSPPSDHEPTVFVEARQAATTLASELETRIPVLKTNIAPADAEYTLAIDGVTLPPQARAVGFRVNPGPHSVRVEATGYEAETRQIVLTDGQPQTLNLSLRAAATKPSTTHTSPSLVAAPVLSPHERDEDPAAAARLRAIVSLSVGGTALVLGGVTGVLSLAAAGDVRSRCDRRTCPSSERSTLSSANTLANVANISIPIGLIGIGYGLYELFTAPDGVDEAKANGLRVEWNATGATLRGVL